MSEKWITKFRHEPEWDYTKETERLIRMVYIESDELGEIICRVFGHPNIKIQEDRARLIASAPDLKQQRDDLMVALEQIRDLESECCPRCEGNGRLYADGKGHLLSENADTILCGNCGGSGRILPEDAQEIAEAAIKKAR